jgi:cytochrome c553
MVVPLPTDARAPVAAATMPPPISGGTLLIARDGFTAIAADPDRDRISVVDLRDGTIVGHVALVAGDQPGRLVQDAAGHVHVALRGGAAVATLDIGKPELLDRRAVCDSPRGIAYDAASDALHVACVSGELVTLPAAKGEALRSVRVATDLRDVVVQGGRLFASQFRSAALLELDASGAVVDRHVPSPVLVALAPSMPGAIVPGQETNNAHFFEPALGRRAIALGDDRVVLLHEREMADTVQIPDPHDPAAAKMAAIGGSPYGGGGDGCQSIVQTAISVLRADGTLLESANIAGSVLPVDVAVATDGTIAIANAGGRDPAAPARPFAPPGVFVPAGFPPGFPGAMFTGNNPGTAGGTVTTLHATDPAFSTGGAAGAGCMGSSTPVPGQPTAVAFSADGALVVQSREPASLTVLVAGAEQRTIALGGESRLDTGHELFHRDAGGGIACGSCHGEGGDDGHVWQFSGLGKRRTQSVNVGLEGTAPFHWNGDMQDLSTLMDAVFVGRMGGVPQSPERVDALASWLFALQPPLRIRSAGDPAATRGKALFESDAVGCTGCHSGEKLTNNKTVDVGTGGEFQVPSLVGVAYRAPFLHDGCAATLRDRFDPQCGGDKHGVTADLGSAQLDDLVAYLESL